MTVSVALKPTYPIPGKAFTATFTATVGNFLRVFVTAAPTGSAWANKLRDEGLSEAQVVTAEPGKPISLKFDKAGAYVCSIREFTKGATTFGGGYAGDPDGYDTETLLSTTSYTFKVAQKLTGELQYGKERGTLALYVCDTLIIPTTAALHGEVSPRIDPSSDGMRTAVETTAVQTALALLSNTAASTSCSDISSYVDDMIAKFNAHLTQAGVHNANDTANTIGAGYKRAGTLEALQRSIGEIVKRIKAHVTNDSGSGVGTGTYHDGGTGTAQSDWANVPIVQGAGGTMLTASLALAACWHAYESHRTWKSSGVGHDASDTTNALWELPALMAVYEAVASVLASASPTAPATDNSGATVLVHRGGLTKA